MLIVQVCDFGDDGDAHYRLHAPSRQLGGLPGVSAVDCHFYHRLLPELADAADVLILQFVNDWELLSLCARRRAAGRVTVFEANDYFFDLQPWSPIAGRWQDRTVQELYRQLLTAADGVQTSTDELARRWRERGARQVAVFANHLCEVAPLPSAPERPLTVGWAGSPGHFADWYHVTPPLARWLREHPDVHVAVMTHELARPFLDLPAERYRFVPFGSLADYLRFLRTLDVGLAPLLPTGYNRCRSDVKFLEYASQGVAGIYADLEPYRASVEPGETGLLFQTPEEMIDRLELLRTDPALRHKLRRQGHAYVASRRLLAGHIGERLEWYHSLMPGRGTDSELSGEVESVAVRDGNYLELRPQDPELTLIDALKKPAAAEATPRLAGLLQRHPHYLAALQNQGRLLNDRREHRAALECLERARALAPHSARTWSEIGRAWYRLNDDQRARAALEEAVRLEPRYLPGWQYLLRLLSLGKSPDGPEWARRADELFPSCYSVALLGAETHAPAERAGVLLSLLDRYAVAIGVEERPFILAEFRRAILAAVQAAPSSAGVLALLRRAGAVFPESARLAAELGSALKRAGEFDEAALHEARALALRRQALLYREEFPRDETPPYGWQISEHIRRVLG